MTNRLRSNGENTSSWECPADARGCKTCVFLGRDALKLELEGVGLPFTGERIEDAKLAARINEQNGVSALSCADRQLRAELIGRQMGEQIVYDSKAPGDA